MDWLKKNWKYLAVVVAAALIVAIVLVVVLPGTEDGPVVEGPMAEGPETGVYYYDTAEGEYVLTLNSGNKFTIAGPSLNKTGKYVVTENGIELDFVKDEDGTGAITMDGDVLNLQYKDKTMRFLEKKTFKVNFNANGGSEVSAIEVMNGKTVAKPADPKKDGSVFIGWYADEACTELYGFGNEVITADTTVYAKWAETVVGQNEYMVNFELGYEAEGYAAMSTIGGKLYNVPVPARDGFTFAGWWVSQTQNAEQLTIPYVEDMVFQANTTLFALWTTTPEGGKLAAPMVEVYADSIKWTTIKGASTYLLKILDAAGNTVHEEKIGATAKNFDFTTREAGEYTIQVTALASVEDKNSETTTRTFVNKALDRVSLFTVIDGGILLWNGVEGAEKYLITIDCGNDAHKHTAFDNGDSTTFMFANCAMQEGGIKFTVTAVADGKASSVSETFVYDRKLDAVGEILYNEETQSFYWDAVANAAKYSITVKVGSKTFTVDNGSATTFSAKYLSGDITLEIVPMTQGYNSPEATSTTYKKTSLATPEGLMAKGNILTWNAVEGATGYMVKINNQSFQAETNSLDLNTTTLTLDSSTTYDISVMAVGTESSLYSDVVTMKYLAPIESVTYKNNTVTWTPVMGVENYEVRVNGGEAITVSGANFTKVTLTKAGINTIEVRYTDLGGSIWTSTEVFAYEVIYNSRSLSGTKSEYLAIGDTMTLPQDFTQDGYDFTGWYNAPEAANGNGAACVDTLFTGTGTTILYANWTPKTYYVTFEGIEGVTNITKDDKHAVTYQDGYKLPVPERPNAGGEFAGWYTGPGASGVPLTDSQGNGFTNYTFTRDTVAYPFFDTGVLTYELQPDGTYAVSKGPGIVNVANVRIPEYYKGVKVTAILDNAFYGVSTMESLNIPATIKMIGVGAIPDSATLLEINVYTDVVQQNYEVFYSSHDGALLRHDMGTTFLEAFPRGKTGEYTIPDDVNVVRPKVFRYARITKLVVGNGVNELSRQCFYSCSRLEVLEFAPGGTATLTIDPEAFYSTTGITTLRLPARLAEMDLKIFDKFTKLAIVEVEAGGVNYSSLDNMICNGVGSTILYAPKSISGDFTIPLGIREIGATAFENCTGLTKVVVPGYVNTIGAGAFQNCTGIREVVIEGNRSNDLLIDSNSFRGCKEMVKLVFQGNATGKTDVGVTTIGSGAFADNAKLANPVYEDGANVVEIGAQAFANCVVMSEAFLPATTTSVGNGAFSGCEGVLNVTFQSREKEISFGSDVFAGCKRLTAINLPASLDYFDGSVFSGCDAIKEIVVDPANENFATYDGALYSKDYSEIIFYPRALSGDLTKLHPDLKVLGDNVFQGNAKITTAFISKNITSIDDYAFDNCYNMTEVIFEEGGSRMTVGVASFANCAKLTNITLPDYTLAIGARAFENTPLTSFVIPEQVQVLNKGVFKGTKITEINIPANIKSIGDAAFANSALTTITFEDSDQPLTVGTSSAGSSEGVFMGTKIQEFTVAPRISSIGAYAFYNQTTLTTFNMSPNGKLTQLSKYMFYGTTKLRNLNLTDSLSYIGQYAFRKSGITEITIPKSVSTVGYGSFYECPNLKTVNFETGGTVGLTVESYAFGKATKLEVVNFPARLTKIYDLKGQSLCSGNYKTFYLVFSGSTKLKEINVEEGGEKFASIDGVLYERSYGAGEPIDTLLYCPAGKKGDLVIPKEVWWVENYSLLNTQLSSITFEEYDKDDENYGKALLEFGTLGASKLVHYSSYGVLSTKNKITINFPSHLKKIGMCAVVLNGTASTGAAINFNMDAHLERVEHGAFYNCYSLKSLMLPAFDFIGEGAFYQMKNATSIGWAKGADLEYIPARLFTQCNALESFEVPASVTLIENGAFQSCRAMKSLTFEEGSQLTTIDSSAFSGAGIVDIVIPDTVTVMGVGVFQWCSSLRNLTLPKYLTAMPEEMLWGCYSLENITISDENMYFRTIDGVLYDAALTIVYRYPSMKDPTGWKMPDTIITIEPYAFEYYSGTTIELPESLETIGTYAFNCSKLKSVHIPKNVTVIEEWAFCGLDEEQYEVNYIEELTFAPDSKLETIGDSAFYYSKIKTLSLPDSVTSIGSYAFSWCPNLEEVILPASITELPNAAFSACYSLKKIVLQQGIIEIGQGAFQSAYEVTELEIPASVSKIYDNAFANMKALETVTFAQGSALENLGFAAFKNCSALQSITLPASLKELTLKTTTYTLNGVKSTFYFSSAFYGCSSLKSVNMSACDQLTAIPSGMFLGCSSLETIILPPNVDTLANWAFGERATTSTYTTDYFGGACTSLKEITIPATVTSIGGYAFNGCTSLETVIFADGSPITQLGVLEPVAGDAFFGYNIFAGTTSLKKVELPKNLTHIGNGCFANSGVAEITLPSSVTHIGNQAFYNCDNIVNMSLSASLVHLGDEAFYDCNNLEKADLFFGLEYLGARAFGFCQKLTKAYIPATVTSIAGNPFMGCSGVQSFELDPDSVSFVVENGVLYDKTMYTILYYPAYLTAETYEFPATVHEIALGAFAGAKLKSLVLPDRIKEIPDYAFANSTLESFTFHRAVNHLGNYAFQGCQKLNNVFLPNTVQYAGYYAFAGCTSLSEFEFEDMPQTGGYYNIGSHFFDGCTAMTKIIIPNRMTYLANDIVKYDSKSSIKNAYGLFPAYMFANTGIVHAVIPAQITDLNSDGVFANCAQMETVTFENLLINSQRIGAKYFYGCSKLKELTLPAGVLSVMGNKEEYAGCTSLEKLTFYRNRASISGSGNSLANCPNLKTLDAWYVTEYEYDEDENVIGYAKMVPAQFESVTNGIFDGTQISHFSTVYSGVTISQRAFFGSKIEKAVIKADWLDMYGDWSGTTNRGCLSGASQLKEVWIYINEDGGIRLDQYTFVDMDHDVNIYFVNLTYDQIVELGEGDAEAWHRDASEHAKFFFSDTLPTDLELPEEFKSAE